VSLIEQIYHREAIVAVIGQGYVGLPVAVRATEVGFKVIGVERDASRLAALQSCVSFVEDVSDEALTNATQRGYQAVASLRDAPTPDVIVISVPTPLRDGLPELGFIREAAEDVGEVLAPGACVILESTTYPGTTEEFLLPILCERSGLDQGEFLLGYSPERIDPGNPNFGLVNTPKVVSGLDEPSSEAVAAFFGALVDQVVPVASCAEAEMTKLLENTFRHVNIALVNELARFSADLGVDIWRVIDAASSKPFGFMRFTPGPGVGGHCLPIDPSYLAWQVRQRSGQPFRFVELANDINDHMPDYVVERVVAMLNDEHKAVIGSHIVALGLAYKANSSDWRESPSLAVIRKLRALGAQVTVCDPVISRSTPVPDDMVISGVDAISKEADLAVVLTAHDLFDWDWVAHSFPLILDTRNVLRGRAFRGEWL